MTLPTGRYCLISPCRDEEAYMRRTLDSVAAQTVPPALWVVVDDGSSDRSPEILAEYAAKLPYLRVVRRENRGHRSVGPGVIDAFYAGFETVPIDDFDYLCKLDLDLDLPPRYFEILIARMQANPRLGTCSGKPYFEQGPSQRLVSEKCGDETSVGMTKFYRRDCFREIGGFVREVMWDGIDCHRCRMLGWMACSWDDPELRFIHLRPMGSSDTGILKGRLRHGFGQYFMGTGPLYMLASVFFRMASPPWILGGLAMGWGYLRSLLARKPRYGDAAFRRQLRDYQWDCLWLGKRRATAEADAEGAARWRERHPVAAVGGAPPPERRGLRKSSLVPILLLALALRIVWALAVPVRPVSDSAAYDAFARNLAAGHGYGWTPGAPSAYWPVGTSAIYAVVYAAVGPVPQAIVILNLLLGLGIVVLGAALASEWFGWRSGLFCGLLLAAWPTLVEFTTVLASELPFLLLVLLGTWAWTRKRGSTIGWSLLAGLALAGACYVRPQALLLPLVLGAGDLLRGDGFRKTLVRTGLCALVMAAAIFPWSLRNSQLFGRFVLISTNGGANFWMGNNAGSSGEYMELPATPPGMNEAERDEALRREASAYIRSHPAAFVVRTLKKFVRLHDRETIGVAWNPGVRERLGARIESGLKLAGSIFWWISLAAGGAGLVVLLRREGFRRWAAHPAVAFWAYFALTHAVIVVQDRYHLPSVPFIAALAGLTISLTQERAAAKVGGTPGGPGPVR